MQDLKETNTCGFSTGSQYHSPRLYKTARGFSSTRGLLVPSDAIHVNKFQLQPTPSMTAQIPAFDKSKQSAKIAVLLYLQQNAANLRETKGMLAKHARRKTRLAIIQFTYGPMTKRIPRHFRHYHELRARWKHRFRLRWPAVFTKTSPRHASHNSRLAGSAVPKLRTRGSQARAEDRT